MSVQRSVPIFLGLSVGAVIITMALSPRQGANEPAPPPEPYFTQANSFFGRGNVENLDNVGFDQPQADRLTAPESLWTVAGTNTVSLNWREQPFADHYEVAYQIGNAESVTAETTTPFYTIKNAVADQRYTVRVRSVDVDGNRSKPSPALGVTPTSLSVQTQTNREQFEVAAWMPTNSDIDDAKASYERGIGTLTEVNPFWYNFSTSGALEPKGGARDPELVARSRQNNMRVIPAITNNFDPERVSQMLTDEVAQQTVIKAILDEVQTYDYDGIDLDFENLKAKDRDAFTSFIGKLASRLHEGNKTLELTVQPKKSDGDTWDGPGAIDAQALNAHVDRFKVMTYDFSRPDTAPGPIAPVDWYKEVLTYWASTVSKEKVFAGIPFYGYDWSLETDDDVGIVWDGVQRTHERFEVTDQYDSAAREPYYTYSDPDGPRVAYFSDASTVKTRVAIAKEVGVSGVAIWLLGSDDPENFPAIASEITTVTQTASKPLNIGLRVIDKAVHVSLTRFSGIDTVEIQYGSDPNSLSKTLEAKGSSIINLPALGKNEKRFIKAIAKDADGKTISMSGIASVDATSE